MADTVVVQKQGRKTKSVVEQKHLRRIVGENAFRVLMEPGQEPEVVVVDKELLENG